MGPSHRFSNTCYKTLDASIDQNDFKNDLKNEHQKDVAKVFDKKVKSEVLLPFARKKRFVGL